MLNELSMTAGPTTNPLCSISLEILANKDQSTRDTHSCPHPNSAATTNGQMRPAMCSSI